MPSTIAELELVLQGARERQQRATAAMAPKHKGGEVEGFNAACQNLLQAERDLAAAKDEPYAVSFDFPVPWDIGAPLPHLLQSDQHTFLIFRTDIPGREEHLIRSTYNEIPVTYTDPEREQLALVEFEDCSVAKLGPPNDEVFHGHPLWGKGFEVYAAMTVENSPWIKELDAINSVHHSYKPGGWQDSEHYILAFHDETFECVATGFRVETHETSLAKLLSVACERMME